MAKVLCQNVVIKEIEEIQTKKLGLRALFLFTTLTGVL